MRSIIRNTRLPDISFYASGRIDITSRVAKMLGLKCGDVIDISVDGSEYYLHKRFPDCEPCGKHAARCLATRKHIRSCNNLRVFFKPLARIMLGVAGVSDAARLAVGDPVTINGILAVPIIYKHNLIKS